MIRLSKRLITSLFVVSTLLLPMANATAEAARVLLLADVQNAGTDALVSALQGAGHQVTTVVPEYSWDGSNPPLTDFDVVIHLGGATYDVPLPVSGQQALVAFVQQGGGYISSQWNGYERQTGQMTDMNDLLLHGWSTEASQNCVGCYVTYEVVPGQEGHPVLAGIPPTFTFFADGHDSGALFPYSTQPPTVLMQVDPEHGPGVTVREFGSGRVVNLSFAANYFNDQTLQDPNILQLYLNSVAWAGQGGAIVDLNVTSITLETREWNGHAPLDSADAVNTYFSLPLGVPGYAPGPKTLTIFDNVSNQITFGGVSTNIGYHHHFAFNAPLPGALAIRMGADFGFGGTLLIDGNLVEFRDNDMWWNGSYADPTQYLKGTVSIAAGPHVIDSYGFELCCDGPQQAQYSYLDAAFKTFTAPANMAPSVTLSGPQNVLTGGSDTYDFSVTDTDPGATFTVTSVNCGVNGTQVGPTTTTATGGSFQCSFTFDPSVVSVLVTDDLGAQSNIATLAVTVADGTPPTIVMPPNAVEEATSSAGAAHMFEVTATDNWDSLVDIVCSAQSGDTFPLGPSDAERTTIVNCTATDDAGNSTSDSFTVTVHDTTPPTLTVPDGVTTPALGPNGAPVTFATTAADAVGVVTTACVPASGTTFEIGTTTVTCTATDTAGNATQKTFEVTITNDPTPGRMHGGGHVLSGPFKHDFNFSIQEFTNGTVRGWLKLQVCQPAPRHGRGDYDDDDRRGRHRENDDDDGNNHDFEKHDDDDGERCIGGRDRFVAQTFTFTRFSNDPSFVPGPGQTNVMDTLVFSGIGFWNRLPGYRYEVRTTDQGEPGKNRDTFEVTITTPDGNTVVASANAKLASGNVQSGPGGSWNSADDKHDNHDRDDRRR